MRSKRVEKLEQASGGGKRLLVCTVRVDHEDEDRAAALAAAGVALGRSDIVVKIRKFHHDAATDGPFVPTMVSIQPCL